MAVTEVSAAPPTPGPAGEPDAAGPTHSGTRDLLAAAERVHRHVRSEEGNDVEAVMATVSRDVCYLMPDVTDPAAELVVLTDRPSVRRFYEQERTFMEVVASDVVVELSSDWYVFHESVATTRQVATGALHDNEVAILFPVASDGIIGEILLARRSWSDVYAGLPDPDDSSTPSQRAARRRIGGRNVARWLDALGGADVDPAEVFTPTAQMAACLGPGEPIVGRGPEAARRRLAVLGAGARRVETLNLVVGDWYVFAEWLLCGRVAVLHPKEPEDAELRVAGLFALADDGRLAGEQSYGRARAREGIGERSV